MASQASYGANVNASVSVNADHGWGGYQWPGGVPSNLLGTASWGGITAVVRKELAELFSLAFRIAKERHGYTVYTKNPNGSGENWGPWGYENRAISGSSTASNHSKGKATDWNAPRNPYASGANFQSDFPVAMVRELETLGLCWGGRYGDAMHWEYGYSPADVAGHVAKAKALLDGAASAFAPIIESTTEDEGLDMSLADDILKELQEIHRVLDARDKAHAETLTDIQNKVTLLGRQVGTLGK